jgi:putative PIN family toxin of toxin-antitoxin system
MTHAILDTNVVVKGLIGSWKAASSQTLQALADNRFRLIASAETLLELSDVLELPILRARHRLAESEIWELLSILEFYAAPLVEPRSVRSDVRDLSDRKFTDLVHAARPDFLVTNDRRHLLSLKRIGRTRIVTPAAFLRHLK